MVPQFTRVGNKSTRPSYVRTCALQLGSDLLDIVRFFQAAHPLTATTRRAL
jgi:hypothetical protein